MIIEILAHTPLWVWVLFALFISRGIAATRERDTPVWALIVLPVVLLAMSIQGMLGHYGLALVPCAIWLAAGLCGGALGFRLVNASAVALGQRGVKLQGSWFPLVLVVAVFLTKYVTEVMIAMHPEVMLQQNAVYAVCAIYGFLTGFFLGRLGRTLQLYRRLVRPGLGGPSNIDPIG